ncbi:MAG: hypothetical protein AAF548_00550 [Actinomycetota bacterium]
MSNKQQTKKRRVKAQQHAARQEEARRAAAAKYDRRRRLIIGGFVGFLALALIAPLTAGLIANSGDDDEVQIEIPTTTTLDLSWVPAEFAGAEISGPTPCPATDGSEVRTTEFAEAPPVCIDESTIYELTFETASTTQEGVEIPAVSLTVPVDPTVDLDAANLATVLGWYGAYEQTPVNAFPSGLIGLGGFGDAGFLVPQIPSDIPIAERYEPGAVLATPYQDGLNGSLMVVVDETGQAVLEQTSDFVRVGTIDDVEGLQTAYEALSTVDTGDLAFIGSVTVTPLG